MENKLKKVCFVKEKKSLQIQSFKNNIKSQFIIFLINLK